MAKKKQADDSLEYFCSQISKTNRRNLKKFAADKDLKLYEALNEVIKKGLQN